MYVKNHVYSFVNKNERGQVDFFVLNRNDHQSGRGSQWTYLKDGDNQSIIYSGWMPLCYSVPNTRYRNNI
jgi:hypothetical protein